MQAKDQRILNAICNGAIYKAINVYAHKVKEGRTIYYQGQQVIIEDKLVGEYCSVVLTERKNGIVYEWWNIEEKSFRERGNELEVKALAENSLTNMLFDALPDSVFVGDRWNMKFNLVELRKFVQAATFLASEVNKNEEARIRRAVATGVDLTYMTKR